MVVVVSTTIVLLYNCLERNIRKTLSKLSMTRLSEYRVMWVLVFFDLPTETKKDRKEYSLFRKRLLKDGFYKFQFSIYVRHCASAENASVHVKRVKSFLPAKGQVCIMQITDKQFGAIKVFEGENENKLASGGVQLELF